eukprot:TRINITY_DN14105_c0_g1_i2.p3 TRINITY_DN14105_c0_g1~~TRINITY_DN14105_c0_g1_i2.p3  ORF type:complete len:153 (+),score=36.97 TRINITY_DN14105_c0_g1_i2:6-464(+)
MSGFFHLFVGCFYACLSWVRADEGNSKTAAVVVLHGLGDDGDGWRTGIKEAVRAAGVEFGHVAWSFPKAPRRAVTLNGGAQMAAWYDVVALDPHGSEDREGYAASVQRVEEQIQKLLQRHPLLRRDRIVVCGFSQGAVIALSTLLRRISART